MKIEKVIIQNFYSFLNEEFNLEDYSGITIIKGANLDTGGSNGCGKSALIEAIYFGLTGKTIRKSTEDTLVNNKEKKNCFVEVHLSHKGQKVVIKRCKKPTKLEFSLGGANEIKQSVQNTQAAIDEFLNTNYKVMLSSMFFGQANDMSFLDCNANDKRTIIRNFLNVGDLFDMRDRIKSIKSSHWQSMKSTEAVISDLSKQSEKFVEEISKIEMAKDKFSRYFDIPEDLSLEDLINMELNNSNYKNEIYGLTKKLSEIRVSQKKGLEDLSKEPEDFRCHTCNQVIDVNYDSIKKFLADITKQEKVLFAAKKKLEDSIKKVPISAAEFSKYLEYRDLCNNSTNYSELREGILESIIEKRESIEEHKIKYEVMRFWEKAFSEQGIIKYIIKNILRYFNERSCYYLSYLTNSCYSLEFDDELDEKITTEGIEVAYISLSGGEKRKINLAVTLALKDLLLLTDKSHANILFMDEITEGIDDNGIIGLYNLLLEIKKTRDVFMVTHNKHLKTLLDSSKRITIIKKNGVSTITTTKNGKKNPK